MIPFVRRSNGINYIRVVNGTPYVYTGASGNVPVYQYVCQTGAITTDYAITFIDEAHPLYVIGSGNIGGMWGPDVYYYNENIDPAFPSCAHILFDVDTPYVARGSYKGESITEDPFYVYPTGVNTTSPEGCELPMPELNIVQIARPSGGYEYNSLPDAYNAIGSISQEAFYSGIVSGVALVWGTGFWDRMAAATAASSNKLWIIREHSRSLGSGVLESGINLFKTYLGSQNIDYQEHIPSCADTDRYFGWVTDCITYDGENVSCTGLFIPPNITQNNIQGSGTHTTEKLVTMSIEGYSKSSGDATYDVNISPSVDNDTDWSSTSWPVPTEGKYFLGDYTEYVNLNKTYFASIFLYYENGIHKAEVTADCFTPPSLNATTYNWVSIVPLDKYGIPNGTLEPDELDFINVSDTGNLCIPRFPEITFTSYTPTSFAIPSGTDCTQFNP